MKIALVKWAEKVSGRSVDPAFVHHATGVYPPLGLLYLAAALRKAGHTVKLFDIPALRMDRAAYLAALTSFSPAMVGFTTTTLLWPQVAHGISTTKHALPQTITILGGPHTVLFPQESLSLPDLDVVAIGEGEHTIVELARAVAEQGDFAEVAGLAFRKQGRIVQTAQRPLVADLDSLPFPARDLAPMKRYFSIMAGQPMATMITSRGCPYSCHFCSQVYWQNHFRMRSADSVVAEMAELVQTYNIREIMVYDETFTVRKQRVLAICDGLLNQGITVRWDMRTRIDRLDEEIIRAVKTAGCYKVHVGIESGSNRVLRKMNKGIDRDMVVRTVDLLHRQGFEILAYFMLGYADERLDEIEQTIAFAKSLPIHWAHFNVTMPAPGTPLFGDAVAKGMVKADYWQRFTERLGDVEAIPYFSDSGLTEKQLERKVRSAYRQFYLRPKNCLLCLAKMVKPDRLKAGWQGFSRLLKG